MKKIDLRSCSADPFHPGLFVIPRHVDCAACVASYASICFSGCESSWSGGAVGGGLGNGMTGLDSQIKCSVFLGRSFDMLGLSISIIVAVLLFLAGIFYFEKVERRFADII